MARTPNSVMNDVMGREMRRAYNEFNRGNAIVGAQLQVIADHDYWWFLEYGTGLFFTGPDGTSIRQPDGTKGYTPEGKAYKIEATNASNPPTHDSGLVYLKNNGDWRHMVSTIHKGIEPVGMVRQSTFESKLFLKEDLARLKDRAARRNTLIRKQELLDTIDYVFQVLLGQLRLLTPDDSDPNPHHTDRPHSPPLQNAWLVTKAK